LYYPLSNVKGIDIEPIAVLIARVTLWMGHRQMVDRFGEAEPVLPLIDLSGIRAADALRADWPEVDAIIGNPPFLGGGQLRGVLGDEYVTWLQKAFDTGIRDLCTYWFRRSQDHLKVGQRAGLVGTNSISQNMGREASLDYVVQHGGVITDAVASQVWPGDAKVHVSIVNWVKQPVEAPARFELDGDPVSGIRSDLREKLLSDWRPTALAANASRCFEGPSPKAKGLVIAESEATRLLLQTSSNQEVVRRYLTARDIAETPDQSPSRWVIDFGVRSLEISARYSGPMEVVRKDVKPEREIQRTYMGHWWQFARGRGNMRIALLPLDRYVAVARHGKRVSLAWVDSATLASDATNVFAFDDDYSMGILMSRAHDAWAWAQSSTLKGDLRYTPTTVFATFPWPDLVTDAARAKVSAAASTLYARRSELCLEHNLGLTKLYNLMDDGAFTDLAALHRALDVAVAAAYGWPASVAQDGPELVRRLTELNREIVQDGRAYDPFGTPTPA
uniref:DNA methyltransferase n=1 Tax=Salinibacterium sp. TaxID=1915057 RepID=UPI0037CB39C0